MLWAVGMIALSLSAQAAELRDVRVWASPDGTRVVFDLDHATSHTLFSLDNPDRVVIDLPGTERLDSLAATLEGKGLVQRVRSAPREDGLRVVLDLAAAAKARSFTLPPNESYGYRVVVDLTGSLPAAPTTDAAAAPAVPSPPAAASTPAPAAPAADPSPRTTLAAKPIIVAIDAGHGGEDPGTHGKHGLLEKDVCLSLARRLATLVDQEPGLHAVLIRDGDYYIGLRERTEKARDAHADLFISIHANSFKDPGMRGTAVYVLSPKGARSEYASMVENRENMADLIGGVDQRKDDTTATVVFDIMQTSAMEASYDAGARLLGAMGRVNTLQKPRVQQAAFVVLKSASFPSVLVETAFLTNEREERLLGTPSYQDALARSMLDGIKGYFHHYRPMEQVVQASAGAGDVAAGGRLQPVSMKASSR